MDKIKIVISYILVIAWMIVIFMFSNANGDASGSGSRELIGKFVIFTDNIVVNIGLKEEPLTSIEVEKIIDTVHYPVRKLAHFTEYLILCLLWVNALSLSKVKHKYIVALIISILYAFTDEYHQTFIDGRAGQLFDVFIDSCGVLTGGLTYKIGSKIKNKLKNRT